MNEIIKLGEIDIHVTLKKIKNVHLSVHPPDGRVTLAAPIETRLDVARAYAISKLNWIRGQQEKLREQSREPTLEYVDRESHYLWGRRYLLCVEYLDKKPSVRLEHKKIILTVRFQSTKEKRKEVFQEWHRSLLHEEIPSLIKKWQEKLGVKVKDYYLQQMRTQWGSCNPKSKSIRLNTELVKKPKDLLEYVVVHEIAHLLEPTHNERFFDILSQFYPSWREARNELNDLPIGV